MALRIIGKITQLCLAYSWLTSHHVSFALPSIIGSKSSLWLSPTSIKTLRMPNVSVPFGHKIRASFSSRPHFSLTWSSCISAEYRFWNQLENELNFRWFFVHKAEHNRRHRHPYLEVLAHLAPDHTLQSRTVPDQGFPCVLVLTEKNLFSFQGTPVFIAGIPVFITGISLWENFTGKTLFSLQGMILQCK